MLDERAQTRPITAYARLVSGTPSRHVSRPAGGPADPPGAADALAPALRRWFADRGWTPWAFQEHAWAAQRQGRSGLIHVPTGAGKTYAAYMAALSEMIEACESGENPWNLRVLYITPLRAVSRDVEKALKRPVEDLGLLDAGITIESRTGDTSSSIRARQRTRLPNVLITTPESLTLLLTQDRLAERFEGVGLAIVDEWHELMSTKRGTQTELALARLRRLAPAMRTWALSATLANLDVAARAAAGVGCAPAIVAGAMERPVIVDSVLPRENDPLPWAGHLGLSMLPRVIESIEVDDAGHPAASTLVFTNTRSQAERWFHGIQITRPEWEGVIGLHHGSVDRDQREHVEAGLKDGSVRLVVATSSLDLGVDFAPVERVMQIGSPKGVARLMQRAGRASHRPGAACRITCVPTHALEMVEIAAVRRAIARGAVESRTPESCPIDVLSQHLVTCALGGGFGADELYDEVRTAWSYRDLTREAFDWALELVTVGGKTLGAYDEYRRVERDADGRWRVQRKQIATVHRLNVGTITGDATVQIRYLNGRNLGSIEENFVSQLRAGQKFVFAGRVVSFVMLKDMVCHVRASTGRSNLTPVWGGTRLPISESLGGAVRETLQEAARGRADAPELARAARLVEVQARLSVVPGADETLLELCTTREGSHVFVYPFEGRLVHAGLAALLALRLSRRTPATFSIVSNDYGFELLCEHGYDFGAAIDDALFAGDRLAEDAVESVNLSSLARRQFREVARVAGLVFQSHPGSRRSVRHLQSKAGLIYEVFEQFDPDNLLLGQARREVLERQFEQSRLGRTLARLREGVRVVRAIERPTPLALPLIVERIGSGTLSSESLARRVERLKAGWDG